MARQRNLRTKYDKLQAELTALTDPAGRGLVTHGVQDAEKVADTALRVRGEAEKIGPVVPRGFLTTVSVPGAKPVEPRNSGRLELADWLASDANPLTQRVFVNRVWSHLFGRGLVSSVDNFGVTGTAPTHPELLDDLAAATSADGWSLKRLVRRLVLTRTYQLGSTATAEHLARDPANNSYWRHASRRLTAEEIRDTLLAASGRLDRARPHESPAQKFKMVEMRDNGPEANSLQEQASTAVVRSIYLPQLRGVIPVALQAFDPVEQGLVTGSREVTTVPGQALFLLNGAFVRQQARELAQRLLAEKADDAARLRIAYRSTLGREPTTSDLTRAQAFLSDYAVSYRSQTRLVDQPGPAAPLANAGSKPNRKPNRKPGARMKPAAPPVVAPSTGEQATAAGDQSDAPAVAASAEPSEPIAADARSAAWNALAQSLFASAEFRYVR